MRTREAEERAEGGLTASLVLLGGDGAGQRTQRKERDECLLGRSKELP